MNIRKIESGLSSVELPVDELLNYLSQTMLMIVDTEINKVSEDNNKIIKSINEKKTVIFNKKKELNDITLELSKQKQLNSVLNLINTLNREGGLLGQNKLKVRKLLDEIEGRDFHALRTLEQKLSIYRRQAF